MKITQTLAVVLSLSFPLATFAQAVVPEETQRDIETLLDLTGARSLGVQMASAMSGQMIAAMRQTNPDFSEQQAAIASDVIDDVVGRFLADKATTDAMVGIYAKHLSGDDIKQLIGFYSSPVGAKLVAAQPQIAQESMQASQRLFIQNWVPQMQQELMTRMQAAAQGPAPGPAPAPNPAADPNPTPPNPNP